MEDCRIRKVYVITAFFAGEDTSDPNTYRWNFYRETMKEARELKAELEKNTAFGEVLISSRKKEKVLSEKDLKEKAPEMKATKPENQEEPTMAAKKTFTNTPAFQEGGNPAMQFISQTDARDPQAEIETPEEPLKVPTGVKPPKGYKPNPLYVEVKSKRIQLVLQPSLYDRVKRGAKQEGLSVNEYVHRILDSATREVK